MKIRNEKGITLLSLIITVIVLIIITYVTISMSLGVSETAKFQNIETYMLLIQTKCEVLSNEKVIGEIDEDGLYGIKVTDTKSPYYTADGDWYKLTQGDLNEIGVTDAKANDGYYFNYKTNDVAYEKGIEFDGRTYHTLSEIKLYSGD